MSSNRNFSVVISHLKRDKLLSGESKKIALYCMANGSSTDASRNDSDVGDNASTPLYTNSFADAKLRFSSCNILSTIGKKVTSCIHVILREYPFVVRRVPPPRIHSELRKI